MSCRLFQHDWRYFWFPFRAGENIKSKRNSYADRWVGFFRPALGSLMTGACRLSCRYGWCCSAVRIAKDFRISILNCRISCVEKSVCLRQEALLQGMSSPGRCWWRSPASVSVIFPDLSSMQHCCCAASLQQEALHSNVPAEDISVPQKEKVSKSMRRRKRCFFIIQTITRYFLIPHSGTTGQELFSQKTAPRSCSSAVLSFRR